MEFPDHARRARLGVRHALAPAHRLDAPADVARTLVALHGTEAPSVHLAVAARVREPSLAAVEAALYDDRSLVMQLAMRRTRWAFPVESLPAVWGSASARVASQLLSRLARDLEQHGVTADGAGWIARARDAVLSRLADAPASTTQLRADLPELAGVTRAVEGSRWNSGGLAFAPRLLTVLGAEHLIVRGRNTRHWRSYLPEWTLVADWLAAVPEPLSPSGGYAELVQGWLRAFGPGTETDLAWWFGATRTAIRAALAAVEAEPVRLDSGATGYVLPGDGPTASELEPDAEPWAALLPTLDPTVMGWKERGFHLDARLAPFVFDTAGNAGNTAWLNGRTVGSWAQDDDGRVRVLPGRPLSPDARDLLDAEASQLSTLLDGQVVSNVYRSRLMKGERLP